MVAKKEDKRLERPSVAKVRSSRQYRQYWPFCLHTLVSTHIAPASPHEVTLVEQTVSKCFVADEKPERLIRDRAFDSDQPELRLAVEYGIELIDPHTYNRRQAPATKYGRSLRGYRQSSLEG
jgi:hypothetical protein